MIYVYVFSSVFPSVSYLLPYPMSYKFNTMYILYSLD